MSIYNDDVLATAGLSTLWVMGEASGNLVDSGPDGATATTSGVTYGQPGLVPSDPITSLGFGGVSSETSFTGVTYSIGNNPWTFEAVVLSSVNVVSDDIIAYGSASSLNDCGMGLSNGGIMFEGHGGSGGYVFGGSFSDGRKHHIALSWDGTTMLAVGDGLPVGTLVPGALNVSDMGGHVGVWSDWFNGLLARVAVYHVTVPLATLARHAYKALTPLAASISAPGRSFNHPASGLFFPYGKNDWQDLSNPAIPPPGFKHSQTVIVG